MDTKNEKGATTLEAALTLLPFFIFLLGIVQVCLAAYAAFTTHHIATTTLRQSATISTASLKGQSRYDYIKAAVLADLKTYHLPTDNAEVKLCEGIVDNCNTESNGAPASFVTLRVKVDVFPVIGKIPLSVSSSSIIKNESY